MYKIYKNIYYAQKKQIFPCKTIKSDIDCNYEND